MADKSTTTTLRGTFSAIADAIRGKDGTDDTMTPAQMPGRIASLGAGGTTSPNMSRAVFAGDKSAAIDVPAMMTVQTATASDLAYCFYCCENLTELTLPPGFGAAAGNLQMCFGSCLKLTSLHLPDGFGASAQTVASCFFNCSRLTSLHFPPGFGAAATYAYNCFQYCRSLTTVSGNPNFKTAFSLSACANLTHDSLMVFVNGLQNVTTATTLTLGSTNLAKLTDEEKAIATDKGWTLT